MPVLSWNAAETEQLTNLFHEGLSFSRIAKAIGGKTKNSCISKSKRIGLPHRGQIIAACERTPREPVKRSPRPRPKILVYDETRQGFVAPPVKTVDSKDWRCDLIGLRDCTCRFPLWDTPED